MKEELGSPNPIINKDNLKQTLRGESWFYLVAALLIAIIVFGGLFWYLSSLPETKVQIPKEKSLIEKQLEELNMLRGDSKPLTEEEIQSELKALDMLRGDSKPLTEEEIKNQLKELDALRKK